MSLHILTTASSEGWEPEPSRNFHCYQPTYTVFQPQNVSKGINKLKATEGKKCIREPKKTIKSSSLGSKCFYSIKFLLNLILVSAKKKMISSLPLGQLNRDFCNGKVWQKYNCTVLDGDRSHSW